MKPRLSERHLDIVILVGRDGLTYEQTADRLGISPKTVETHVERLAERFDLKPRRREGLVHLYYSVVRGPDG